MALIQFGPNITGIRNSVAGQTFSQNKGGAYTKAKPIPSNPRTPAQTAVRANFATNSKLWSGTLTPEQRAAWTLFAGNNPYNNVFGQSKQLSGMAMMMSLNQVLLQIGAAIITDAPADLSVPALAALVPGTFAPGAGTPPNGISVNTVAQAVEAGAKWYTFATGPLAAGKTAGQSDYRYVGAYAAVAAATAVDMDPGYAAAFPGAGLAGQNVSVLVATVNVLTGAVTPALRFDAPLG